MLNKLQRPKWQHKDPEIRRQAIAALDPGKTEDLSIIRHLAEKDDAEQVRSTAIQQLTDMRVLLDMLNSQAMQADKATAVEQIRCLLSKPSNREQNPAHDKAECLTKIFALNNRLLSPKEVAMISAEAETGLIAFEQIQAQQDFVDLVQSAKQIKVKLAALEKIEAADTLKSLQKSVSEKPLLQSIRDKLKQHKANEDQQAQRYLEAEKICTTIEKLAPLPYDERYAKRLQKAIEQWQATDPQAQQPLQARFAAAQERCKDTVALFQREQRHKQTMAAVKSEQTRIVNELVALKKSLLNDISAYNWGAIQEQLDKFSQRWQQAGQSNVASDKDAKHYYQAVESIAELQQAMVDLEQFAHELEQQLTTLQPPPDKDEPSYRQANENVKCLQQLKQRVPWPKGFDKPESLALLEQSLSAWQSALQQINQTNKNKIEQIHKKTTVLQKEIRKKNLISANKLFNYIEKQVQGLDEHFQGKETARLSRITESLAELRDWHQFATQPKKEALCESMEALIDAKVEPMERAGQIKSLQLEWKQLNSSNTEIDQALWERFKAAADKAFEPCLAFYAQRDAVRADNLKNRMQVCDRLEAYLGSCDWEAVDWKHVEAMEKNARSDWARYKPVPNKETKAIQKRFDASITQIREKLDSEREKNLQARKSLVDKADALVELEDLNQAIEQAIVLQKQWKEIGVTFFRQDQKQWKKFRAACNKVFERRDQQRSAGKEKLQFDISRAQEIIAQLVQMQTQDDIELVKRKPELAELRGEFYQLLKSLPANQGKRLKSSFAAANKKLDQQLAGVEGRKRANHFSMLEKAVALCEQIEAGGDKASLQSEIENMQSQLAKKHQNLLQQRLQHALKQASEDGEAKQRRAQANLQQRADICLQLEILLDISSHEQYRADRTAYQLQQLQQGLQARPSDEERKQKIQSLLLQWLMHGPVAEGEKDRAEQRFEVIKQAVFA